VKSNSCGCEAHPDRALLERFMSGQVTADEGRSILKHLMTDCEVCREITGPLAPFGRTARMQESNGEAESVEARDATASTLLARLRERQRAIEKEREEAQALFAELQSQEQPHRLLLVRNSARFHTWGLAELLIEESYVRRHDDSHRTMALADLAVEIVERMDESVYGSASLHDLRARAWAMKGNALRILSDLRGAGRCLNRALKLLEQGTGDPLEEAKVCEFFAALRSNQRRVDRAVRLQHRAMRLYRRAGHAERLGRAMVDLASYNALAGDRDYAIELVQKALEMVDAERDPRTVLAARHNLAVFLQESGRLREAMTVLAQARSLYDTLADRNHLLRLRWLEGCLARDIGETKLAEEAFLDVYQGFVDVTPLAAAQVCLELAALYLDAGREDEVAAIVIAIEKVFRAHEIDEHAVAAWLLLREAVERRRLHTAVLKDVAARLRTVSDKPKR
jgi:tetratricopeptide (TPR) repeat protein